MSLTPHGPGFTFLDALEIVAPGQRARGRVRLDPARPFFADHFPGQPLMPGVLLVECAAQAAGAFWQQIAQRPAGAPAYLAAVQQFRFHQPVLPGQVVTSEITLTKDLQELAQFDARLLVEHQLVAEGKLVLSRPA